VHTQDAILRMHVKLIRTAKALRLAIANEVLRFLDAAQEQRALTTEELEFRRYLKAKSVGLAALSFREPVQGNTPGSHGYVKETHAHACLCCMLTTEEES